MSSVALPATLEIERSSVKGAEMAEGLDGTAALVTILVNDAGVMLLGPGAVNELLVRPTEQEG
jgi:hypothetical protein